MDPIAQIIANEIRLDWSKWNGVPPFVNISFFNDFLVDYDSQLGINGPAGTSDYLGFERWERYFDIHDATDFSKVSQADLPVPHNLMARDNEVINRIISSPKMLVTSLSSARPYITSSIATGITITGLRKGTILYGDIILPTHINGSPVVGIGPEAFKDQIHLEDLTIPASVTNIGVDAFYNCPNLNIRWVAKQQESIPKETYSFPNQYFFTEYYEEIRTLSNTPVHSKRLRTGLIYEFGNTGNQYLTLSAKRRGARKAFMEYHFPSKLSSITYELALWSDNESLILNSSIRLEVLSNNVWITLRTFLAKSMSQSKNDLWTYQDTLPPNTKSFRFIIETNSVQYSDNRGRIVIGDIGVEYQSF